MFPPDTHGEVRMQQGPKRRVRVQGLSHARSCVIVPVHVRVRVRRQVSVMCLCVHCGGGYACGDVRVHVRVHVRVRVRVRVRVVCVCACASVSVWVAFLLRIYSTLVILSAMDKTLLNIRYMVRSVVFSTSH